MKTRLHVLLYGVLICGLLFSQGVNAQVDYSEDFEDYDYEWGDDFYDQDEVPCGGAVSLVTNIYGGFFSNLSDEAISPSLGTSSGGEVTFTYDYKIVTYADTSVPVQNEDEWGSLKLYYATSATGPWTLFDTVDTTNHVESASCAPRTATFVPPGGQLYIRMFSQLGSPTNDIYIYIDNIEITQEEPVGCDGTPDASSAVAVSPVLCNGVDAELSLSPVYTDTGLSFQWQSSTDGENFEDVATGGTSASYSSSQTETTWYRAIITCDAGDESVTSEAIQIVSTGLDCPCETNFENAVEPITLVNFAGINNTSTAVIDASPALEDFTYLAPAEVVQGGTYDIELAANTGGTSYTSYFKIYIDFNHNGSFEDEDESFEAGSVTGSSGTDGNNVEGEITIPIDAMTGITYMRVFKTDGSYATGSCETNEFGDPYYYGQAEDYLIDISAAAGCTVAPEMAVVESDATSVCTTEGLELSLSMNYSEDGITFQWQSSEDGEEFADIEGADQDEYETEPTNMDMWYRAVITCENGDLSTTTEAIAIATTGMPCYCEMEFANDVEPITLVQFAGIDNESDAVVDGSPAVEDFTSLTPGEVMLGGTYDIAFMGNTGGDYQNYFTVYIDFNHNGDLSDEGEAFPIGTLIFSTGTDGDMLEGEITIPDDVMTGITLMRVVKHYTYDNPTYPASLEDPCGEENTGFGQAEDYLLNITEPPLFNYYNLQWPATMTYPNGTEDYNIYAQAYEPGVTEAAGLGEGVMGWIGFSTENTDPATWDESSWVAGTFNQTDNNNDEVMLTVDGSLPAGTYYYASRWQLADGPYTYGGFQGASGDEGVVNGVLTVLCLTMEASIENPTQEFCNGATVADLQATATEEGGEIVWYLSMDAETPLSSDTLLADGTAYFAAQLANGCESVRNDVVVTINMITPPVVNNQIIEVETGSEATVEDLTYTGEGTINWYANLNDIGENSIDAGTMITPGTYYATLTVDSCESDYVTFTVDVLLGTNGFTKGTFTYYPNPVKDMLKLSYSEGITGVEVFNLVGQRVISMAMGQNEANVDMSALASGTYVVKVSSGDTAAMIKVVKE